MYLGFCFVFVCNACGKLTLTQLTLLLFLFSPVQMALRHVALGSGLSHHLHEKEKVSVCTGDFQ